MLAGQGRTESPALSATCVRSAPEQRDPKLVKPKVDRATSLGPSSQAGVRVAPNERSAKWRRTPCGQVLKPARSQRGRRPWRLPPRTVGDVHPLKERLLYCSYLVLKKPRRIPGQDAARVAILKWDRPIRTANTERGSPRRPVRTPTRIGGRVRVNPSGAPNPEGGGRDQSARRSP